MTHITDEDLVALCVGTVIAAVPLIFALVLALTQ